MSNGTPPADFYIRPAVEGDVRLILRFIKELASYERLPHEVVATEESVRESLFGERPTAEVSLAYVGEAPAAFSLYFHNFSTFLGQPGIYLEDLYVKAEFRRRGLGRAMFSHLARLAKERGCGRLEWAVLNWNETAIAFYRALGAVAMDEWTVYRVTGKALDRLSEA